MKSTYIIIGIAVIVVVLLLWWMQTPTSVAPGPQTQGTPAADSTASIQNELQGVSEGNLNAEFESTDSDINSL